MFAKQAVYAFKSLSDLKRLAPTPLRCCKILFTALAILGVTKAKVSAESTATFSEGHWVGQAIKGTSPTVCIMTMQLDDTTSFAIYADASGDFNFAFTSAVWKIPKLDEDFKGYLEINGEPVMFTRMFLPEPNAILLRAMNNQDAKQLEQLMRKAENMTIEFATIGYSAHTTFFDNHLAVSALKNCTKSVTP